MVDIINLVNGVVERIDELCAAHGVMANMCVKGCLAGIVLRKSYVSTLLKFAPNQSLLRTIYIFAAQQSMLRCAPKQQMVRSKVVRQRLRGLKVMEDITLSTLGSLYLAVTRRIGNMVKYAVNNGQGRVVRCV